MTIAGSTTVIGAGSVLMYAKYNPLFRERVKNRFPLIDDVIKVLWQEKDDDQ